MKRFRFSEQALLSLRQQEKRAAEAGVLNASRAVAVIEDEIDAFHEWLLESLQVWSSNTPTTYFSDKANATDATADYQSITDQKTLLECAQRQLARAHDRLAAANQQLEQSRNELRRAEIAVNTLATLRKERYRMHRQLWRSKQQHLADEVTMRRWMSQRREGRTDD